MSISVIVGTIHSLLIIYVLVVVADASLYRLSYLNYSTMYIRRQLLANKILTSDAFIIDYNSHTRHEVRLLYLSTFIVFFYAAVSITSRTYCQKYSSSGQDNIVVRK